MFLRTFMSLIILCHQVSSFTSYFKENITNDIDSSSENLEACVCVPYWQCKEDFSGLVENGIDLFDVRSPKDVIKDKTSCLGEFDVCCKAECGRRDPQLQSQIYKGKIALRILGTNNEAEFGEFPWMLGILENGVYRCGGSLIHPQVALTAAHCVSPDKRYKIRAGEWNWENQDEPFLHQNRWSKKVIIHPQYHFSSLTNDIALVILEEPFKIGHNVGIICLPRESSNSVGKECTATGWGKNSLLKGSYQATLKKVHISIVDRVQCTENLRAARLGPYFNLHKSFICAGGDINKDTCKGDGGGPLICPTKENEDRYQQVGIVSWGLSCGMQNTPGVYVNVALFREWIDLQMKDNGFDPSAYSL